ncbi:hypothetical protein B0A49_02911 [Cryomyces minteri]|uniref:C2H2-type domain-containing protein n=1 Tax=Cryomyces minteri TaxID=331657 RepID=A0A4U0XJX3_9PEZI|nr:hypothetical protein B0A49_02911 [Cryomyces minteri]
MTADFLVQLAATNGHYNPTGYYMYDNGAYTHQKNESHSNVDSVTAPTYLNQDQNQYILQRAATGHDVITRFENVDTLPHDKTDPVSSTTPSTNSVPTSDPTDHQQMLGDDTPPTSTSTSRATQQSQDRGDHNCQWIDPLTKTACTATCGSAALLHTHVVEAHTKTLKKLETVDHKRRVHETLKRYACGACAYRCAESSNCASHRKAVHDPLKGVRCPHIGCTYADTRAVKQPRFLMEHCVAMGEGHDGYVRGADGDGHGDAGLEAWIEREKERVDGLRGVGVAGKRRRAVGVVEAGA